MILCIVHKERVTSNRSFHYLGKGLLCVVLEEVGVDVEVVGEGEARVVVGVGVVGLERGELLHL